MTVCKCLLMILSIISGICQVSILKQEKDMLVNSEKRASDEVVVCWRGSIVFRLKKILKLAPAHFGYWYL